MENNIVDTRSPGVAFQVVRRGVRLLPDWPQRWRFNRMLREMANRTSLPSHVVVHTNDGFRINVHPADHVQRELYLFGRWGREVAHWMRALLAPGDVCIDIGANIGYFTLLGARLVGPRGRVLSFEPNPFCFEQLEANIALNAFTHIEPFRCALGERPATLPFYPAGGNNSGAGSLLARSTAEAEAISVEVIALDDVLRDRRDERVAVVKVDVEGAEVLVLRGMTGLLSRADAPAVICEVSEWSLEQMGQSAEELFSIMRCHGYISRQISPKSRSIFSKEKDYFQYDMLFYKEK
jgi:FkbM family methyltransferase